METVGDLYQESGSTETQQQKQNRAVCTAFRLSTLASEDGGGMVGRTASVFGLRLLVELTSHLAGKRAIVF